MSIFEGYLTLWVALCIVGGIALGQLAPGAFHWGLAAPTADLEKERLSISRC